MKKKKRDNNTSNSLAIAFFHMIFLLRRRRQLFPLISALSGFILFLFVAFSFLSSSPPVTNHHYHSQSSFNTEVAVDSNSNTSSVFRVAATAADSNFSTVKVFRVPENGGSLVRDMWRSRESKLYYGCSTPSDKFQPAKVKTNPNRYLLIATSGGLNQQRTGITDAVVAAYILNATLIVPKLDQKSYWKDTSDFEEIFDVDWFISSLSRDVEIIKELPVKKGKVLNPHNMRVPRKCSPKFYESRVLPVLNKKHAVQLTKFDYRLSNKLDTDLQKLRCRVNYHALKFTNSIRDVGKMLVERMRFKTKHFIALHLRFEPDMLAFSGCYYGGGDKERAELGAMRKRWKNLRASNPDKVRRQGRCPLTPEEVGLMLRALGFGSDVHLYIASGEVFGGEETLAPLKALFPNLHSKETLASKYELEQFQSFSSRMAALDFIVCDESDVFVTNNNGNMARILAGRRRYFGHKPTIRPNAKKLNKLFTERNDMTWEEFASRVGTHQIGFMGDPNEVKPGRGEFHENPTACICEDSEAKERELLAPRNQTLLYSHNQRKDTGVVTDDHFNEIDHDWSYMDYMDNEDPLEAKESHTLLVKPEMEEYFLD